MTSPVVSARAGLAALGLVVFLRALGENSVRAYAIVRSSDGFREHSLGFLFLWLGMSAVPAFALAPLIGALGSSRGRWPVMVLSTLVGLVAIAWSSYEQYRLHTTFWLGCITVLAVEAAFFNSCRFALIPEAVEEARVSLPRTIGFIAMAAAAGTVLGISIGIGQSDQGLPGLPIPLQAGHLAYGVALICLLACRFPARSSVRVNDGLIKPFAKTVLAIVKRRYARNTLLDLWFLFAIGLAVSQWLYPPGDQRLLMLALIAGLAVGSLQPHPHRTLGMVPYASIGLIFSILGAFVIDNWSEPSLAIVFFLGVMAPPLLTIFMINQPESTRGHGAAILHAGCSVITGCFLMGLVLFMTNPPASHPYVARAVLALGILSALWAWLFFFRAAVELTVEVVLWPMYRIKAVGTCVGQLPWRGPMLVVGNHAAWLDPFWLAKVLPMPVVPMMTSKFYDLPFISWMMRRVVGAIRVPSAAIRKEAPELDEAIAALDRGECVVIFPEGWLRRKDEQELRRFGRGIWQILKSRPETPVLTCWIEGGWGSMVSHKNGPPLKQKKIDRWRPIRIGMLSPRRLDPILLTTHMAARTHLMEQMLEARSLLGLPPIDPFRLSAQDEKMEAPDDEPPEDSS